MRRVVDKEVERVNGNSLVWILCTVFSVMVFFTVVSEDFLNPGKCVTPEEAAYGGVVPLLVSDGHPNCG